MHWLAIRVALGLGKGELLLLRCDNVNLEGSVLPKPLRLDRPGSNPAPGLFTSTVATMIEPRNLNRFLR